MKKAILSLTILAALALSACGAPAEQSAFSPEDTEVATVIQAPSETAPVKTARQDGERFQSVLLLEGMEETVNYEHIVNPTLGFEMDYDYESLIRQSGAELERFVSVYDDPAAPENYLDVTFDARSAELAADAIRESLSDVYDTSTEERALDGAGRCLRIEASALKGTDQMAEQLQAVYVIPASDGCRVATAHYAIEAAEGFGHRFDAMMNTLTLLERNVDTTLSDELALSAIRSYCLSADPDLEEIVNAGEYPVYWEIASSDAGQIVVLYRSYTGALLRYYIDRMTGETYVTEFVPGITSEEQRTEESFNVRDYFG